MNNDPEPMYRFHNFLHTMLLLSSMLLLAGAIGWLVAGTIGVIWSLLAGSILAITAPRLTPHLVLYLYDAKLLPDSSGNQLQQIISSLTSRCNLTIKPKLYYIPSTTMLAFTVGIEEDTSIAISDGLLRQLNIRELTAVLAHEVSHIKSRDIWVMTIADIISRLTSLLAFTAYIMIIFLIPFFILENHEIPYLLIILLMSSPSLSALMQLALSRTREFSADMQAIKLTGDPQGLISALNKIDSYEKSLLKKLLLPNLKTSGPSLLRTHPLTEDRINRLALITENNHHYISDTDNIYFLNEKPPKRKPRQHISGLWH